MEVLLWKCLISSKRIINLIQYHIALTLCIKSDVKKQLKFKIKMKCICIHSKNGKGSPYSITKRGVPDLILVLGSQPAGDVSHKPDGHYFLPGLQLPSQTLRGQLPISLLDEQWHHGCEQLA